MLRKFRSSLLVTATLFVLMAGPARADGEQQAIEAFNQVLMATMQQGPDLGFTGRYDMLAQPLAGLFDFETMTRIGLQRHWAEIGAEDREAIIEAFAAMSIATFANRFDNHNGEAFVVESVKPGPRNLRLVSTRIERPGRESVNLTYVMRDTDAGPRVIDVLAQGRFSELARQRAEMSSVFSRSGVAGLVAALNEKADKLAEK